MSRPYSFTVMNPLPTMFRTVALLFISLTAVLAVFYFPTTSFAQPACGDIISINPYSGDTEQIPIEDCSDPFAPNQTVSDNLDLVVDGVVVEPGASQVTIPNESFQYIGPADSSDFQSVRGYRMQVYQQSNDDFVQIDLRPPDLEDLSQAEGLAVVEEYYAANPDVEVYKEVYLTDDMSGLTIEQNMSYSNFLFTGATRILQERYSPEVPVGSYWIVFTEEILCVSKAPKPKSWLARAIDQLIPTAHAQFGDPCSPGYILKRFVVELDILQESEEPAGASSVLFLPGIQASRLYVGEDIVLPGLANNVERGEKLWELTNDKRIALLAMDESRQSVYDIYTEDVVEEVTGLAAGANIYKGFLQLLKDLKEETDSQTDTSTIVDYLPFAYDWRYSVFDVATQPVQYEDEAKVLKDEVIALAEQSHTGKVTIVAHSNGGLVAKALLHEYGDNELQNKVDKVVMIGTPQLGTPKGISALLHGQVMDGFGDFLTKDAVLRETIQNMPGTYTLLPSARYLEEVADQPLVRVPEGYALDVYDGVSDRSGLDALLLDTEDVVGTNPTIKEPMQLNSSLLSAALAEQTILDAWQPPAGVEIYEVAGTGIPTPAAIHYEAVPSIMCPNAAAVFGGTQCEVRIALKPKLQTTVKGDQTVVLGSARGQLGDKRTLTVDLIEEGKQRFVLQREHADLTESPTVQEFVRSVIRFPYLTDNIVSSDFSQLISGFTIHAGHSPVTLRVVTPDGLVTGIVDGEVREDITGTQFLTLGGSSYVIIPEDVDNYTLEVIGTGNGMYTLETSTLSPDDIQTVVASFTASTTDTMIATMEVADGSMQTLQSDFDADGVVDEVRTATGDIVPTAAPLVQPEATTTTAVFASATRVGDRAPAPAVLGVSVSVVSLTAEQQAQLHGLLVDVQYLLDQTALTADQLVVVSELLDEALLIIDN